MISRSIFKTQLFSHLKNKQFSYIPKQSLWFLKKKEIELPNNVSDEGFEFKFDEKIQNPVHQLVIPGKEKLVGWWLLLTCASVFFMITLGGYTRLSNSGLSMVKWKPVQVSLPSNELKWEEEFEHYKQYPEYQEVYPKIDIQWLHRLVGSSLGVVFTLPFALFAYKGFIKQKMTKRLLFLLGLGGSQGLIGWWMVKSGLEKRPDYQDRPRVSVYRLSVHLNTALTLYGILLWNSLTLLRKPQELLLKPSLLKSNKKMRFMAIMLCHFVAFNTVSGSIASGIDAMKVYNDWPFFNGQLVPDEIKNMEFSLRQFFENKAIANFNHRTFGYLTFIWTILMCFKAKNLKLLRGQRYTTNFVGFMVTYQAASGIATLMHNVPKMEAQGHQFTALIVLTSILFMTHRFRKPSHQYREYVKNFLQRNIQK